jgi:hypothetical protein
MGMAEIAGFFPEIKKPHRTSFLKGVVNTVFVASREAILEKLQRGIERKPLRVYNNIDFIDGYVQSEHFATKEEVRGFLSGSEGWTLCSKGESIYSHSFAQCSAALVRNRNTGLITLTTPHINPRP